MAVGHGWLLQYLIFYFLASFVFPQSTNAIISGERVDFKRKLRNLCKNLIDLA